MFHRPWARSCPPLRVITSTLAHCLLGTVWSGLLWFFRYLVGCCDCFIILFGQVWVVVVVSLSCCDCLSGLLWLFRYVVVTVWSGLLWLFHYLVVTVWSGLLWLFRYVVVTVWSGLLWLFHYLVGTVWSGLLWLFHYLVGTVCLGCCGCLIILL